MQAVLAEFVLGAGVLTVVAGFVSEDAGALMGQSASSIMAVIYWISKGAPELCRYRIGMSASLVVCLSITTDSARIL